jgi:hypothetical protein
MIVRVHPALVTENRFFVRLSELSPGANMASLNSRRFWRQTERMIV